MVKQMSLALSPNVSLFVQLAAEAALPEAPAAEPQHRSRLADLATRVAAGLAFAQEWRRRADAIQRLHALPDDELARRGYDRGDLVKQVYWYEFAD